VWLQDSGGATPAVVSLKATLGLIATQRQGAFFFVTKHGFAGFSQVRPAKGDCIVLPHWARCFLLLRPAMGSRYRMVAPAFVAGLMNFTGLKEYHDQGILRDQFFEVV
jgi:hypothetical protein